MRWTAPLRGLAWAALAAAHVSCVAAHGGSRFRIDKDGMPIYESGKNVHDGQFRYRKIVAPDGSETIILEGSAESAEQGRESSVIQGTGEAVEHVGGGIKTYMNPLNLWR